MHPIIHHINKITDNAAFDQTAIMAAFESYAVKKKQILLEEGKNCGYYYFVVKGCLRLYFLDNNGVEQTIQFALENWWMTDLEAFKTGKKAVFSIQALEASEVLAIDNKGYQRLLNEHPIMEKYFRLVYERAYTASLFRINYITRLPKNEFYVFFSRLYPDFVQRIPQKILASFLGFTPEYLSELRKKLATQKH